MADVPRAIWTNELPGAHDEAFSRGAYRSDSIAGVPEALLSDYAFAAARHARLQEIESGLWFAEVVGLQGAWGEGPSRETATADLTAAIFAWASLKLRQGVEVPIVDGFDVNPVRRA